MFIKFVLNNFILQGNGYYCTCEPGWTGFNCDMKMDNCFNNLCFNGGTCIDLLDKFKCQCLAGYAGKANNSGELTEE